MRSLEELRAARTATLAQLDIEARAHRWEAVEALRADVEAIDHEIAAHTPYRLAVCGGLSKFHGFVPSSTGLGHFQSRPEQAFDAYYCGCEGSH